MKQLIFLLSILFLHASDNEQDNGMWISATVFNIKKINQQYPNLKLIKIPTLAICYQLTWCEKLKNLFKDPSSISNNDRVYLKTTNSELKKLINAKYIGNVLDLPNDHS